MVKKRQRKPFIFVVAVSLKTNPIAMGRINHADLKVNTDLLHSLQIPGILNKDFGI
jgi:hypothetical protein